MGKPKSKRQRLLYPKAIKIKASEMAAIVAAPGEKEVYRQTRNWDIKTWYCPKAHISGTLGASGKWRVIKNRDKIMQGQSYRFLIWKIWQFKDHAKIDGKKKWNCTIYVVLKKPYSLYYLVCKRARHSIQGVY